MTRQGLFTLLTGLAFISTPACVVDKNKVETPDEAPAPAPEEKVAERVYPDPPPPEDPRPVNFPELQQMKLPNGLAVYVVENHEVPLVDVQLVFKTGSIDDELRAGMTADILLEGTGGKKGLSKAEINERIEQVGSSLDAGAGRFTTTIGTRVLKPDLDMALELVSKVAMEPKMDPKALDKLKDAAKVDLRNQKSTGQALGSRLLGQILYPEGHPYGRPFSTDEQIDAITVDDLKKYHETFYVSNNAYLILSGDITLDEVKASVEKTLGKMKPAQEFPEHPLAKFTAEDYQKAKPEKIVIHLVDRKSISTEIFVANLSLARNHADWIKWTMVNKILGAGVSSRLFQDIRETKDLTYGIGSTVVPAKGIGSFVIATQTKFVDEMMDALFDHIDRIREEDPTQKEFDQAKNALSLSFPLTIESAGQVANMVDTQLTYGLPENYFATYRDEVLKVEMNDVKATAAKWIDPTPVIVMVGRKRKILSALANVEELKDAEVIVYDTDLKKIETTKP